MLLNTFQQMPMNSERKNSCWSLVMLLLFFSFLALTIILCEGSRNWWRGEGKKERRTEEKHWEYKAEKHWEDKAEKHWEDKAEKHWEEGDEKRTGNGEGRTRLRRQSLPTDNVLVYASNSNVSVTDQIQVLSKESQIRILERNLNTTVWSNASLLQMSPSGDQISLSASEAIALVMKLGGAAQMEGTGDTLQLNDSSLFPQSSSDDFVRSRMEVQLTGQRVNLSLVDLATRSIAFSASDARIASLIATDWTRKNAREEVRILSTLVDEGKQRELSVVANSPDYQVQIRLIGAESALLFRDAHLQIPADHRSLLLNALDWHVNVRSAFSPFELQATDDRLQLHCFEEALSLVLLPDALQLHVGQLSSLFIVRSPFLPGKVRVNGAIMNISATDSSVLLTDRMEMISRDLSLFLSWNGSIDQKSKVDSQSVLIDAVNSQLRLFHSNRTLASLTAAKHFVEILGGRPSLQILTGNVSVEMELRKERKTVAELNTDIVPKELMRTENAGDSFGSGPFVILSNGTTSHPIVLNVTNRTVPTRLGLSASASSARPLTITPPPLNWSSPSSASPPFPPPVSPVTPQMADPSELFTFRHTFPPSLISARPSITTENERIAQLNESAFPSPDSELFTFPPSLPPDADFLVGQFESVPSPRTTQSLFPLSATISALQFPEEAEKEEQQQKQSIAEQFPGIRRENLLIWRPEEQMKGAEESKGEGKLETYLVDEQEEEGEEGKRPRRTLNNDGRTLGEQLLLRAKMELDIAVEGEEDVRAERLRRELGEGIERMLEESGGGKRTKMRARESERGEETQRWKEREKENSTETEESGREEGQRTEMNREEEKMAKGNGRVRVTDVHLEYLGQMEKEEKKKNEDKKEEEEKKEGEDKKEMVRIHFTLEGDQRREWEEGIERIGQMDKDIAEKALLHEILSKPRLTNGTSVGLPFSPSSATSSTLSAISAHSLPALFLGSLCLFAALLTMLLFLRPSARAFSRINRWIKRTKGNEWKVKRIEGKMCGRREKREGNAGGGILPM